jgi:hypothetical protein
MSNDIYFRLYLDVIRRPENQHDYIDFLLGHRPELAEAATCLARTAQGLLVEYGHQWADQHIHQANHPYLFHGTRFTWPIIESWHLRPHRVSVNGYGVYFGMDFETALHFAGSDESTLRGTPIHSILVFRNDQSQLERRYCREDELHEYRLKGEYSLDSLEAIVFLNYKSVMEFGLRFDQWQDVGRKQLFIDRKIKLYDRSLKPLDWPVVLQHFDHVLMSSWRQIGLMDPELYFWPVGRPGWQILAGVNELLVERAKQLLPDPKWLKLIAKSLINDNKFGDFERFIHKALEWNETVYVDVLLEVLPQIILNYVRVGNVFERIVELRSADARRRIREWAIHQNDLVGVSQYEMDRTNGMLNYLRHL